MTSRKAGTVIGDLFQLHPQATSNQAILDAFRYVAARISGRA